MGGGGGMGRFDIFGNKNAKGDPLDFLTTPNTPLKIIWPKPQGPLMNFQLLCIYVIRPVKIAAVKNLLIKFHIQFLKCHI